jgi:polyferredoxin
MQLVISTMTQSKHKKKQQKATSKVHKRYWLPVVLGLLSIAVIAGGYFYSKPTPGGPIVTVYRSPT